MPRELHDREDLMRDATQLVERVELKLVDVEVPVVCGFRCDRSLSIYWGQDDVMQFNSLAEFRRGFWRGRLIACYQRQLHWLNRVPEQARASFRRELFTAALDVTYRDHVRQRLQHLSRSLADRSAKIDAQVPDDSNVAARVLGWTTAHANIQLALHPGATAR